MLGLSHCPICHCIISSPACDCRRCGAQILLLAKIFHKAHKWREQGKTAQSQALYTIEEK